MIVESRRSSIKGGDIFQQLNEARLIAGRQIVWRIKPSLKAIADDAEPATLRNASAECAATSQPTVRDFRLGPPFRDQRPAVFVEGPLSGRRQAYTSSAFRTCRRPTERAAPAMRVSFAARMRGMNCSWSHSDDRSSGRRPGLASLRRRARHGPNYQVYGAIRNVSSAGSFLSADRCRLGGGLQGTHGWRRMSRSRITSTF